jgi:hypothetical protein
VKRKFVGENNKLKYKWDFNDWEQLSRSILTKVFASKPSKKEVLALILLLFPTFGPTGNPRDGFHPPNV